MNRPVSGSKSLSRKEDPARCRAQKKEGPLQTGPSPLSFFLRISPYDSDFFFPVLICLLMIDASSAHSADQPSDEI